MKSASVPAPGSPSSPSSASPAPSSGGRGRLMSLDALRGFDMFWILGGESLAYALHKFGDNAVTRTFATQLEHVSWAGFHFYDLVFPLFVFIVGVSLVFSLGRTVEEHGRAGALRRVFRRALLLYVVGLFYSGGFTTLWPDIRLLGVLNRIALCYFFASLIFIYCPRRWLAGVAGGLLVGYWALMTFVPFADVRPGEANGAAVTGPLTATRVEELNFGSTNRLRGTFEPGLNLANYLDQRYLPGKKWEKTWDPEGLLSTIPAVASCLLGVLAGLFLLNGSVPDTRKVAWLVGGGAVAVAVGFAWGTQFPVIKKIWTSTFVLVAGGYSAILLGVFYWVVDVRGRQGWCQPFVWIGMNPITLYLADNLLRNRQVALRFFGGDIKAFLDTRLTAGAGDLLISLGEIGVGVLIAWFLHRRRIFLRL